MSSALAWLGENVVGLVVEDGQLAIGIVLALAATVLVSLVARPLAGWVLLALLVGLLLLNLALTARRAKRRMA